MKILHYAFGFPPYRSGGLTKFCVDLMVQQAREGHNTAMLWPGQMNFIKKETLIKDRGYVVLKNQEIHSYEIINPLPIPLDEGIAAFTAFTADIRKEVYETFLDGFQPNVIHIHTLMGLHKSFLDVAKNRNIQLVFTAHDFFPICPKVKMFRHGTICNSIKKFNECGICNATALSLKKIQILQSPIYRKLKDSILVKKLRKYHRDNYLSETIFNNSVKPVGTVKDYKNLRAYYYSLLKLINVIHYNSSITKMVYESIFNLANNCVINITHADILDNRVKKTFSDEKIRLQYLGPQSVEKGFFLLKETLDRLWNKKQNFCLDVYFTPTKISPYMKIHEKYSYKDLKNIFNETDVLVAPSIWYETFGFTVLEALSYGVPVIISGTVGAKDILVDGAGIVIENIDSEKLYMVLQDLTVQKLKDMNTVIVKNQQIMQIKDMSKIIEKICYGWK